jgi:hypothetical protein
METVETGLYKQFVIVRRHDDESPLSEEPGYAVKLLGNLPDMLSPPMIFAILSFGRLITG